MSHIQNPEKIGNYPVKQQILTIMAQGGNVGTVELPEELLDLMDRGGYLKNINGVRKIVPTIMQSGDSIFLQDLPRDEVKKGEPVYPHQDESDDLSDYVLELEKRYGSQFGGFGHFHGCFAGALHNEVKIAENANMNFFDKTRVTTLEFNPRATLLSQINALINKPLALQNKPNIVLGDVHKGLPEVNRNFYGPSVYFGNAPFALQVKGGKQLDVMRDGGENGLEKTLAFIDSALEKSRTEDVIAGVAYTRMKADGTMEISEKIKQRISPNDTFEVEPMEEKQLYRNPANGLKEQPNPMSLDNLRIKAIRSYSETGEPIYDPNDLEAYDAATRMHQEQGWTHLAYVRFHICNNPEPTEITYMRRILTEVCDYFELWRDYNEDPKTDRLRVVEAFEKYIDEGTYEADIARRYENETAFSNDTLQKMINAMKQG